MLKKFAIAAMGTSVLTISTAHSSAHENTTLLNQEKLEAYASYFGFKSATDYLKFSSEMNRLMAGDKVLGSPIYESVEYKEIISSGKHYDQLSAGQKASFAALLQHRRSTLATALGIPESDLENLMSKYVAFVELNTSLNNIGKSKVFSSDDDPATMEHIEVTASQLGSWGGFGGIMMSVGIANAAAEAGIGQYTLFTVHFVSRGTKQDFRYNNFSGAWSVSSEMPVCIDDSCHTAPQPY